MANYSLYETFSLCYLLLLGLVFAENHGVTFLYPTTDLTLNYRDTVNVSYLSPFPAPMLFTFCFNSTNNDVIQETQQNVQPYNGSQLVELVWQGVSSCNFDLRPNISAGYGANSPVFIVLPTARAVSTTVGLPTATSTSSSMSGSSSSTSTATGTGVPSTGNTETALPSSNSGLNGGAKAGIGVGVAAVAVALLAGITFFFLRRRRSKNPPENHEDYYRYGQKYQPVDSSLGSFVHLQQMGAEKLQKPSELSSDVAHELAGGELRHKMSPETVAGNIRGDSERGFP